MITAAIDPASFGFGTFAGASVMCILLAVFDHYGWIGQDHVNWQEAVGVTVAGIAPVLGILAALVVWLVT